MENLDRKTIKEKSAFLQQNSTYFYSICIKKERNLDSLTAQEENSMIYLKDILFSTSPLKYCDNYDDLIAIIKEANINNEKSTSYLTSIKVLFSILISTNYFIDSENKKADNRDVIRKYLNYLDEQKVYKDEIGKILNLDDSKIVYPDVENTKKKS